MKWMGAEGGVEEDISTKSNEKKSEGGRGAIRKPSGKARE